ncbi:hypothetical protein ACS3SW_15840 [Roseobacteraceae bacterium S113]
MKRRAKRLHAKVEKAVNAPSVARVFAPIGNFLLHCGAILLEHFVKKWPFSRKKITPHDS